MKQIKAYIRTEKVEEVDRALERAGVAGFTAIEVMALGRARAPEHESFSIDYADRVSPVTKLEIVCTDADLDMLVEVISKSAFTGHPGDGMIFVSDVGAAIKIRTGEYGDAAVAPCGCNPEEPEEKDKRGE